SRKRIKRELRRFADEAGGIEARAVAVARARERVERPDISAADRERGRTISLDGNAADILEKRLRFGDVIEEFLAALAVGAMMRKTVRGQFVSLRDDRANERGIALGDPAKREEGCLDATLRKHLEHALDIALDAAFACIPARSVDHAREGF